MLLYRMRLHLAWTAAAVLILTPTPTLAAQQPWDQQKVTQVASQLAEAVSGVYDEFRKQPSSDIASMQQNARYRLQDDLRLLESETHVLVRQLKSGEGRDATQPIYDRIGVVARNARENARRQMTLEPVQKRVDRAEKLWAQLTPYYTKSSSPAEESR